MRQLATKHLVPGMMTGTHVFPVGESSGLPLLAANVVITEAILHRLQKSGVETIYISDELSAGIEPSPAIDNEVRMKAVSTLKTAYEDLQSGSHVLSANHVQDLQSTMRAIISDITGRRKLLVCLSDLNMFGKHGLQRSVSACVMGCNIARAYFNEYGWIDFRGKVREDGIPDRIQKMGLGLLLADVGMLMVPREISDKRGILTAEERLMIRQHPTMGIELLEGSDLSPLTKVVISQHHERFDGSGYPRGLQGDEIHGHGSVAAIATTYMTLTEEPQGMGGPLKPHEAWKMIAQGSGILFRPEVVEAFTKTVAPYGPGTSIQLSNGSYGIVVRNSYDTPARPTVRITHDADGVELPRPFPEVDLAMYEHIEITDAVETLPGDGARQKQPT